MHNNNTDQLIELIYEAAITPEKWTDLLNSLAELVDYTDNHSDISDLEQGLPSLTSNITSVENNESNISISETLKSITNINEEKTGIVDNKITDVGQVNEQLMEHFARAIKIAKRLVDIDEKNNVVLSLLDRMPIALVLVDAKAQVIEMNSLASEMLSSESGLKTKSNILSSGSKSDERLLYAIKKMSKHDPDTTRGQSLSITNEATQNNIMLFIAPLKQYSPQQKASVAIFISQRKSLLVSLPKEFSELYKLTNKEQTITEQLVRGLSIKDISEEACVSEHTVRSHVKSILKKTRTSRQVELVSLVYNGMNDFVNSISASHSEMPDGLLSKTNVLQQDYKILELSDGRNLAYVEYGDLNGEPVFHCHSIFGCRLELSFNAQKISEQKAVRLIVMDRPGYGASDPDSSTNFTRWVKDLVQLADHLNIERFSLTGYVMGTLYALACAHEIPERIKRVALITTGFAPQSVSDYKNVIPLYKMNYRIAKYMPKVYKLFSTIMIKGTLSNPDSFIKQLSEKLDQADSEIMNTETFRLEFFATLTEGFRQGGKSFARDVIELMHGWSFKPSMVNVPIDIWHGTSDFHLPLADNMRLVDELKDTRLFIKEGQGHYMFYTHWAEILDELLKQ